MRVPLEWLAEYADAGLPARDLGERLTMTGTKVEAVHRHGVGAVEHFLVGRVLSADRHPDADRLTVCVVDVGDGESRQIVCGAPNVAAGQLVAVAGPGAVMPDGTKLRKAKLRGVESNGMILAEDELAIGTDHAGILVLEDGTPGAPLSDLLPLATDVLEFEVTPNRPDCLGVYGIAREVHATTGAALRPPPWAQDPGTPGEVEGVEVRVEVPDLCPRFTARAFEDVAIGPSPPWLKARLTAAGMRPISNVVDITNYAMLLTGQPLHAFDLDRVAGQRLVVRAAREGETIDTLDGQTRTLQEGEIVIDDADGPTSLAGVMGGARSEVAADTTRVLLEVAAWHAPTIHRTSTRLGLRSEASARFEKGLSAEQPMEALAVATQLMVELCGARLVPGTIDAGGPGPEPEPLRLRPARVERLLGMPVARERQRAILESLGFGVAEDGDDLAVTVPHFRRADVTREADLVEEVARIEGLDRLPATLPSRNGVAGRLTFEQRARRRAEDALVGRGLTEVVGWSFTEPGVADRLRLPDGDPRRRFVALENPMSEDQSVLRTTLLGSLLDAARHNAARGRPDLALFESGAIYLDAEAGGIATGATAVARRGRFEGLPLEAHALGALLTGRVLPESWRSRDAATWDFHAAKAVLGAVLDTLRIPWDVRPPGHPFLHPGRAARVFSGETELGWIGEVHPLVARAWDLDGAVAAFEVDLGLAIEQAPRELPFTPFATFPPVRRDLAVVVPQGVTSAQVLAVVREAGRPEEASVFDVYGDSLAMHLAFRAPDRTLTDEEADARMAAIVGALRERLGVEQRA
ncbi:MAG TPA: phenylalanine--tRNA ligase subunit beta [Solirubrobacteraceae bacterium]|jgi:phenylalanyl-tRNA synthetase beta chain|nr:phenylalanine--tRNA ligase subunit beta [Solirubrobacteraceae bacterium]